MYPVTALGVLLMMSTATAQISKKSIHNGTTVPNDELMNALYISDPDPSTGYMDFWKSWHTNYILARLTSSSVEYDTWLEREHDANEAITNLWSYTAHMVVSNLFDLYGHCKVTEQLGNNKPTGVIDFKTLSSHFLNVSETFDSYNDTWPYSSFSKDFFKDFSVALLHLQQMVNVYDTRILYFSYLGVDNSSRSEVLESLFSTTLLNYIPSQATSNVFYHSIVLEAIDSFTRDIWSYSPQIETEVTRRCSDLSGSPVAIEYYCKAKDVTVLLRECLSLNDVVPCLYYPLFQDYFEKGRFRSQDELAIITWAAEKTRIVLTSIKDRVSTENEAGIRKFVQEYNSHFTIVNVKQCVHSWPKSFDCGGNYTCRINTMYRFDCLIRFLIDQSQKLLDVKSSRRWSDPIVQTAKNTVMIWLSYLPMANYVSFDSDDINDIIISTQRTINDYVTSYNIAGLTKFSLNLPPVTLVPLWARNAACQTVTHNEAYTIYCTLEPLLNSVHMFVKAYKHGRKSSVKVLNPNVDYRVLIEQLQLDRIQQYINEQTQSYFNDITSQLQHNFGSLSTYFSSLADYDKQKATADIDSIDEKLQFFSGLVNTLTDKVKSSFSVVLGFAIGANTAEAVQKTVQYGVAVAQVANPLSTLLGGSSILDLMDSINDLAQTSVTTAVLVNLSEDEFPEIANLAKKIGTGFLANKENLDNTKALIDGIKEGTPNMDDIALAFLEQDEAYDSQVLKSDISLYGEKLATVAETLCEAAFSGDTAASALVEVGLATSGDCTKMSAMIAQLITVYEELYDFQFDLMDTLADAVRANLAFEKANKMKLIYTSGTRVDQAFLQNSAVNTYMVSVMHIWAVITEYCDVLTYIRGGEVPKKCDTAINSPSHENVAQVLSYNPAPLCHVNNEITDFHAIPTQPSGAGDKGYIDLEKLYNLEEVTFQIPNHQWLQNNGWVHVSEDEQATYVSRFELYLPPMSGTSQHTVEITAKPSSPNYLSNGGTKYILPVDGYSCRYTENSHNCYKKFVNNPYTLCRTNPLSQLCVTSNGHVDRYIQPSIYNEWKVSATSLPLNQVAPKPTTNFKLQVGITMCRLDMANRKRRDVAESSQETVNFIRNRRGARHCCSSHQYWNGTVCATCPSGSSQRHNGYYCQ